MLLDDALCLGVAGVDTLDDAADDDDEVADMDDVLDESGLCWCCE